MAHVQREAVEFPVKYHLEKRWVMFAASNCPICLTYHQCVAQFQGFSPMLFGLHWKGRRSPVRPIKLNRIGRYYAAAVGYSDQMMPLIWANKPLKDCLFTGFVRLGGDPSKMWGKYKSPKGSRHVKRPDTLAGHASSASSPACHATPLPRDPWCMVSEPIMTPGAWLGFARAAVSGSCLLQKHREIY